VHEKQNIVVPRGPEQCAMPQEHIYHPNSTIPTTNSVPRGKEGYNKTTSSFETSCPSNEAILGSLDKRITIFPTSRYNNQQDLPRVQGIQSQQCLHAITLLLLFPIHNRQSISVLKPISIGNAVPVLFPNALARSVNRQLHELRVKAEPLEVLGHDAAVDDVEESAAGRQTVEERVEATWSQDLGEEGVELRHVDIVF
jgi:hypothetical protein